MDSQAFVEIHVVANKCRSIFATCNESPLLAQQDWFRRALAEFNLWCANLKATRSDKSSLDHHLGPRMEMREDICDLLHGLGTALERCHESIKQEADGTNVISQRDPNYQHSNSSNVVDKVAWDAMSHASSRALSSDNQEITSRLLAESILYVKTILHQLSSLSLAIRKAGNRYRFERIDAELDNAAFEEFRTHLTTVILRRNEDPDSQNLVTTDKARRVSDYNRLSTVQKRLVQSDVRRRNRMCSMATPDSTTETGAKSQGSDETKEQAAATAAPKAESNRPPTIVNTATRVETNFGINKLTGGGLLSHFTAVTKIRASIQYPPPPESAPGQPLRCPYCWDEIPGELSNDEHEDTWRSHVDNHLSPYTCVVAECTNPSELYVSPQALLDHTIQHHSFTCWVCDYCPNGKAQVFTTMASWDSHVAEKHFGDIPSDERALLGEMSKRQMIGPLECPLCEFTTDGPATVVDDHILRHLHEFALRALPPTGESVVDGSRSSAGSLDALPRTDANNTGATIASGEAEVTLDDIHAAIRRAWDYFNFDGVSRPPPLLGKPSFSSAAAKDIWLVHSTRLVSVLNSLKFDMDNNLKCDILKKYEDAIHAVEEMKSAGGSSNEFQSSPTVQFDTSSKLKRLDTTPSRASKGCGFASSPISKKGHRRGEAVPASGYDPHLLPSSSAALLTRHGSPWPFQRRSYTGTISLGASQPDYYEDQRYLAHPTDQYGAGQYYDDYSDQALEHGFSLLNVGSHHPDTNPGLADDNHYIYEHQQDGTAAGTQPVYDDEYYAYPPGQPADSGGYPHGGGSYEPSTSAEPGMSGTPGQGFDAVVQQAQAGAYTGGNYPDYEDDGAAGPSKGASASLDDVPLHPVPEHGIWTAQSRDGSLEEIDMSQFRLEWSSEFSPGTIFKVMWSEPRNETSASSRPATPASQRVETTPDFYAGIRRFIVVTSDDGNSSCVPILTYERRACTKRGVNAKTHGIIHGAGHKPISLKHEPRLGYEPVAVNLISGERLASESRVNYAKLQTIEHNVRVRIIGRVVDEHLDTVRYAVDDCWLQRAHHTFKKRKSKR